MNVEAIPKLLLRPDEELSQIDWPELEALDEISLGPTDCLIVGTGFEDRALALLRLASHKSQDFHVGLVRYLPKIEQNRGEECQSICDEYGIDFVEFVYDREHPSGIGPRLADYGKRFNRIYLDISGMSRLLIVQTIVSMIGNDVDLHILYSEAESYPPGEKEYQDAFVDDGPKPSFVSSGIFEIVSTPELSSVAMLGGAIRLISFPSFDPIQLSNLVQEVQPTHNNVVNGLPPSAELAWRTAAIEQSNNSIVGSMQRVEIHETSTLDYRETIRLILALYKRHSAFDRIVIAPTGSKMQAVATGILRGVLTDLQIVYPTPLQFVDPGRYTQGVKQFYHLALPSAKIAELRVG